MPQGIQVMSAESWGNFEPRVRHLEIEVGEIKSQIKEGSLRTETKLDAIATQLASQMANASANKPVQLPYLLDIATKGIVLIAAFTTVVVYLARNGQSDDLHRIDTRLLSIEQRLAKPADQVSGWSTTVTKR